MATCALTIATLLAGTGIMLAADDAGTPVSSSAPAASTAVQTQNDEIVRLKAALAEQQKQIQALQQAIASDSMLQNSDVKAVVQGDRLLLTGTVSSQNAKDRAEQIATPYATQNNLKLINHIDVGS